MLTVGVDPGLTGAVGFLRNGEYMTLFDMVTTLKGSGSVKQEVDPIGLRRQFGMRLDRVLEDAYRTNPNLREEVDNWFSEGGQVPDSAPSPTGRATEEVLAERSEIGPFDASTWDKIKNVIKDFGRRIGLKNLKYSDREINTILAMAHATVIKGGGRFTGADLGEFVSESLDRLVHLKTGIFDYVFHFKPVKNY